MVNIVLYLNNEEDIKKYLVTNKLIKETESFELVHFESNDNWIFLNIDIYNKFKFFNKINTNSKKCWFLYSLYKNYFNFNKAYEEYTTSNRFGCKIEKIYFYTRYPIRENDILFTFIKHNNITYPIYSMRESNLTLIKSKRDVCHKIKL